MAADEKLKSDLCEDSRADSGVREPPGPSGPPGVPRTGDKQESVADERVDSAYGSSSLNTYSLTDLMRDCSVTAPEEQQQEEEEEEEEEEENILATITEDGDTLLHLVVIHEEKDIALQLIDIFPREVLDIQNNLNQTPLHLAIYLNLLVVVQKLLQRQVNVELQDQEGNTALHVACEYGRTDCCKEMVRGLSSRQRTHLLTIQNWKGLTCLHVAVLHRNSRLLRHLVNRGADLNVQEGTSGKTPLHMAVELHDRELVTLLLSKGANVDAVMFNGCTALHLAVGRRDSAVAHLLCQSGADKMLRNMEDETALDLADGNSDILAVFPFDDIHISQRSVQDLWQL